MGGFQSWKVDQCALIKAEFKNNCQPSACGGKKKSIHTIFWDLHVSFQFVYLSSQQLHPLCCGLITLPLHQSLKHIRSRHPSHFKCTSSLQLFVSDPTIVTPPDLFQQLIVLQVLLSRLVGGVSLRLKSSSTDRRCGQFVNQGDHSLHNPTKIEGILQAKESSGSTEMSAMECEPLQPEKDSKSRDVEVPLRPEQLHVQVIVHIWHDLRFSGVPDGVFPYFTNCI